ncbi:MAG: ThiF family adenylyltransferase [Nanobdellota archaeon]
MSTERTTRQDAIEGWNPEALETSTIGIVGSEAITGFTLSYLAGLGTKQIKLLCGKGDLKLAYDGESLSKIVKAINPTIEIEHTTRPPLEDDWLLQQCQVIVDTSNNPYFKERTFKTAKENASTYISASSKKTKASIVMENFGIPTSPLEREIQRQSYARKRRSDMIGSMDYHLNEYANQAQGTISSAAISALVTDKIRSAIMPLRGETNEAGKQHHFTVHTPGEDKSYPKKVLVVGAGGIGTYIALNLALLGMQEIHIADHDTVSISNLNRQILYREDDAFEHRNKAQTLCQRLQSINPDPTYRAIPKKITSQDRWILDQDYDLILSGPDNPATRRDLSHIAVTGNVPIINGAITPFAGYINRYIPEKTACLNCQNGYYKLQIEEYERYLENLSCATMQESNVVVTNAFVGAFMVDEALKFFSNQDIPFNTETKFYCGDTYKLFHEPILDYTCHIENHTSCESTIPQLSKKKKVF